MNPDCVHASTALLGPGLDAADGVSIRIEDGTISDIEVGVDPGADDLDLDGITLLPGFIDTHVHIGFWPPIEVLVGGVTTVRDLAWPPEQIYPLVHRSRSPDFEGPEIVAAGPMLTCPAGYPVAAAWAPPGTARIVTDVDDARSAVRERVAEGAVIVKVALNPAVGPTLSEEVLQAICDEAHSCGLEVTGHVFGIGELEKAIRCGMDELAHMLMSSDRIADSTIDEMVARGMRIVPTLAIHRSRTKRATIINLSRFVHAGGRIIYGTDLGNAGVHPGIEPNEIDRMARSEMSPTAILASATVEAAAALRLKDRGVLASGYRADIIGVRGDPTDAPIVLKDLVFVMRGGIVRRLDT
ncbi:MAG TPA: amidohydrolase family protein [Actinomycetota bacterium]|nr:amidohydrolase family protein [Actinomycetota bacterium]